TGSHAGKTADPHFSDQFAGVQPQAAGLHADPFAANQSEAHSLDPGPFGPGAGFDMGAMGPYGASDLPLPTDLPGGHHSEPAAQGQPWYLQSQEGTHHSNPNLTSDAIPDAPGYGAAPAPQHSAPVPTIECP